MCATFQVARQGEVHGCTECHLTASPRKKLTWSGLLCFCHGEMRTHEQVSSTTSAGQPMCATFQSTSTSAPGDLLLPHCLHYRVQERGEHLVIRIPIVVS